MDSESRPSEMEDSPLSPLSSIDNSSDSEPVRTEWLATTRQKRSTAGNRMKSMLANEEPDSDLELLFAEDENDQGFSDAGGDASDINMDSSSDDEDENNAGDDMEGEKELEKQAKERRAAQRKRKAQDAIPAKFRKKVRIDSTTPSAPSPTPRPKKKSERTSWLPSPADLPTRASSRQTTRLSKEQLHQQMVEREAKRLKQLAQMQLKAARLEALKKPPMTQEERLREAELVEKRNSKSLNRWEEAEKQREEERRAKLAALHQRTLRGPVLTFWSGYGNWVDDKMKLVGRHIVVEEQPKKRKPREKPDKDKDKDKDKGEDKAKEKQAPEDTKVKEETTGGPADVSTSANPKDASTTISKPEPQLGESAVYTQASFAAPKDAETPTTTDPSPPPADPPTAPALKHEEPTPVMAMPRASPLAPPSGLAAPAPEPAPQSVGQTSGSLAAPPGMARPPESKPSGVLAAPVLAPPPSAGVSPSFSGPKSNVLAPPNTNQPSVPLVRPSVSTKTPAASNSSPSATAAAPQQGAPLQPIDVSNLSNKPTATTPVSEAPAETPAPDSSSSTTRNAIIYQNFDENAIKDKSIQTQILFGRKMNKLAKPSPAPLCVITNHPAKYRDPKTGLPYFNAYAYREIQRLTKGEYKWSQLLGAWVGTGTSAARGVPERFLNPSKKREVPAPLPVPTKTDGPPIAAQKPASAEDTKLETATAQVKEPGQSTSPPTVPAPEAVNQGESAQPAAAPATVTPS
ncbi:YL1 nuclear protein-domain-containing protein [Stachybotrys elegans]|uniref:YL1 nuclear protein-domain-containing protein n=1 Tax=Stachybotrys elegans TaxID=80388 RepID=A0A8K0WL52_9HYPO|nr:YL1 nuclear protein-domain-containing protein [Stachybotrys elegans]